jgi:hypothetical protein
MEGNQTELMERKQVFEFIQKSLQGEFDTGQRAVFIDQIKKKIYNTDFDDSEKIKE